MKTRIAVQNRGRLREPSLEFLRSLGLKFEGTGQDLIVPCDNAEVEILFVRNSDVPTYVEKEVATFGIVGRNVLYEGRFRLPIVKKLDFGECSLVIAAPEGNEDLEGERIATSYPYSLKKYLKKRGVDASIVEIKGSVEIAPVLNLADAVCDITQTGRTLAENNLKVIDVVLESQACLISNINLKNYEEILLGTIR